MFIVNKSQVQLIKGQLYAEASSIGLPPGDWPDFISVLDDQGKGFLFQKGPAIIHAGEFQGYRYQSRTLSAELLVIND